MLVTNLALKPEHPEIVTTDGVDVVAHLVVEAECVRGNETARWRCRNHRGKRVLRTRIINQYVGILVRRFKDTAFDAKIGLAVSRRSGRSNGRGCHRSQ